jgi:hypothetical protein
MRVTRRELTDPGQLQTLVIDHVEGIEPGLAVLDSRLLLGQATIDIVGLDVNGALVLIAVGLVADEEMLLKAVEAYSWCLEYPEAIRRLYPAARISPAQPPRLMFVVERMPDAFHRKIKQLGFPEVDCVEFRYLDVDGTPAAYFETLARLRRTPATPPPPPERTAAPPSTPPASTGRPTSVRLQRLLSVDRPPVMREPAQIVSLLPRTSPRAESQPRAPAPAASRVEATRPRIVETPADVAPVLQVVEPEPSIVEPEPDMEASTDTMSSSGRLPPDPLAAVEEVADPVAEALDADDELDAPTDAEDELVGEQEDDADGEDDDRVEEEGAEPLDDEIGEPERVIEPIGADEPLETVTVAELPPPVPEIPPAVAADVPPVENEERDPAAVVEPAEPPAPAEPPRSTPSVFSRDRKVSFADAAKDLLAGSARTSPAFPNPTAPKPPRTIAPPPPDPNPIAGGKLGATRVAAAAVETKPAPAAAAVEPKPAPAPAAPAPAPQPVVAPQGFEGLHFPNDGVLTRQWMEFLNQMAAGK